MPKTILCADDSATMQTVAEITFNATDYQYVGARSADEALEKARSEKPDLILADAVMPGKTGYELCQAVKSDPSLADVPVVMMCGNSQAYDPEKGKAAGADGHVSKPWDTQQMLDKVGEFFEKTQGGVAKPAGAGAEAAKPAAPAAKEPPATPKPAAKQPPETPAAAKQRPPAVTPPGQGKPAAPRSATLMGMPTLKTPPGKEKPAGVTPISPPGQKKAREDQEKPSGEKPAAKRAPTPPPTPPKRAPTPPPTPKPEAKPAAKPAAEAKPAAKPPAEAKPAAKPAAEAKPAAGAKSDDGAERAPMIQGKPTRKPRLAVANARRQATATAANVAREAGLDPQGPEMALLIKLSSEVVERIVWEVVPELAEVIIRENLEKLTARE